MTKSMALLVSAGLTLALAGCGGTRNRGLESVHQPVVDRADYALDLATSGGGLARGEQERLIGWFGKRFLGQPQVVGEMIAGVVLGPSLFGLVLPDLSAAIFPPESKPMLYVVAQLGVGLYMFLVGLGFDRDDVTLTYEVFRGWRTDVPLYTETRESVKWRTETFTWRDTGVTPGQKVYYRVRVTDPSGQSVMSVRTPDVTVGSPAR